MLVMGLRHIIYILISSPIGFELLSAPAADISITVCLLFSSSTYWGKHINIRYFPLAEMNSYFRSTT
jgi:hypothetical protein